MDDSQFRGVKMLFDAERRISSQKKKRKLSLEFTIITASLFEQLVEFVHFATFQLLRNEDD